MLLTISFVVNSFLKVWAIADKKRQGFLGFSEFITAMQVLIIIIFISFSDVIWGKDYTDLLLSHCCTGQLVSLAQAGEELTPEILKTAGKWKHRLKWLLCYFPFLKQFLVFGKIMLHFLELVWLCALIGSGSENLWSVKHCWYQRKCEASSKQGWERKRRIPLLYHMMLLYLCGFLVFIPVKLPSTQKA